MAESPDYKELLQLLNEFEVEYLIVGGFAVMKYGEPRYTKDLDVWVRSSASNSLRLIEALKKFGAPLHNGGITGETFREKQVVYQIGIAPVRVDILTEITGVEFADAWKNRRPTDLRRLHRQASPPDRGGTWPPLMHLQLRVLE
jgi:hypothetical protein